MAQEVYMDIPQVQKMAESFKNFGDTLRDVAKKLEAAITVLKLSAFVGLVGGYAVQHFLQIVKPRVEKLAQKMDELSGDLTGAINHYRDGDESGSSHFR